MKKKEIDRSDDYPAYKNYIHEFSHWQVANRAHLKVPDLLHPSFAFNISDENIMAALDIFDASRRVLSLLLVTIC